MSGHLWANPVHGLGYNDPYGQTVPLRGGVGAYYPGLSAPMLSQGYSEVLVAQEVGPAEGEAIFNEQMKRGWSRGWAIGLGLGVLLGGTAGYFMFRR